MFHFFFFFKEEEKDREKRKRKRLVYILGENALLMCIWQKLKSQLILLSNLFLLLFMGSTALFGTIHGSQCIISANFLPLSTVLSAKSFSVSKISESQTDP